MSEDDPISNETKKARVTLLDVARRANVSRATASLVIRKSPLVGASTRIRVEDAMRELGYVYHMAAARLRAERSHTIGVIVPNLRNPFFAELLSGIEAAFAEAGMAVLLANSGDLPERQDQLLRRMREHGVDGVIACLAAGTDPALLERLQEWRLPLVQVLRHISRTLDYAGSDYRSGIVEAVGHLVGLGHHEIAFAVHGPVHSAYTERVEGFRAAMHSQGLSPEMIVALPMGVGAIAERAPVLFSGPRRPTAVICFNDVIAMGLAAGLHDLGIVPGENFSLIGFDDVAEAEAMRPRLTSVSTAPVAIGQNAAALLLSRLAEPQSPPRRLIQPTELRIRQSCCHPPQPKP